MKVIAWNCNAGKFQTKKDAILKHEPDILVVPECEPLEKLVFDAASQPTARDRIGDEGQHRGLAVFCFNGYRLERSDCYDPEIKFFLPLRIFKDNVSLTLLASWVWHESSSKYLDVFNNAVDHYAKVGFIGPKKTLFLGDFNSPGKGNNLDNPFRKNSNLDKHKEIVEKLSAIGLRSLYHSTACPPQEYGKETVPTYFDTPKSEGSKGPFHCDYCFASEDMQERLIKPMVIGKFDDWIGASDHMPLIMDFRDE